MLDICLTLSISVFSLCWWPDSFLFKWMHFFVHDKSWLNYFSQLERITITCCTVVLVCCVLHPKKHHHSSSKKQPKQELIQSENKTSSWKVSKTKCLMSGFPPPGWSVWVAMDRYQDEIRKAAAKSVKDLNLANENLAQNWRSTTNGGRKSWPLQGIQ